MLNPSKKVLCVISARGGSTGIKNKNIINFCGKPLISWSILQAKKSKYIDEVYVSTDSLKIAEISKSYGAKVPFLRSKKFSTRDASKFLVWKDTLKKLESFNKKKYNFYLDIDCTSPLRETKDIDKILLMQKSKKKFDAIITVSKSRKNPYFNMLEKDKKKYLVLSKKIKKWPTSRQKSPLVFDQIASMYLVKTNFLKKSMQLYNGKILGYELNENQGFDIDNLTDYEIISHLFKKNYKDKI